MILGVDVGGTFTDAALLAGDRLVTGKAPTTPADQSEGVMNAVEEALGACGAQASDVERFVHGMTVGTNALLEGKVARTALLATAGFTDLEELGRQARAELYRLCAGHPPPLVPAELRVGVPERTGRDGVIEELDEDALQRGARRTSTARPPRSACSGAFATPATSGAWPSWRRRRSATCTCRPRTRPRACSASTSAAPRPWWTPRCRRCCAATSPA